MVWQPTGTSTGSADDDVRVGTVRSSMLQNPLLAKPELGKIKPILFNRPTQEHVFGYAAPKDPEGAREVTMLWADHKKSKAESELRPVTDFKTMNKMAVDCGVTTAKDLPSFRASNKVLVKDSPVKKSPPASVPSSRNPTHTYGTPPGHRSQETVRSYGPMEPPVKHLIQGAYQDDWVLQNLHKEASGGGPQQSQYIPPAPTRAVLGHSIGALRYLQPPNTEEPWKMSKFKTVGPKVTQYMTRSASASPARGPYSEAQ